MRTAKSCGPDIPTLISSRQQCLRIAPATVTKKPVRRGEHEGNRKTIARGMPGASGVTVVTCSCAFFHCTRGCGRIERPAFPAPSPRKRVAFVAIPEGRRTGKARANCVARTGRRALLPRPSFETRVSALLGMRSIQVARLYPHGEEPRARAGRAFCEAVANGAANRRRHRTMLRIAGENHGARR
jgi:hypothetical protein